MNKPKKILLVLALCIFYVMRMGVLLFVGYDMLGLRWKSELINIPLPKQTVTLAYDFAVINGSPYGGSDMSKTYFCYWIVESEESEQNLEMYYNAKIGETVSKFGGWETQILVIPFSEGVLDKFNNGSSAIEIMEKNIKAYSMSNSKNELYLVLAIKQGRNFWFN